MKLARIVIAVAVPMLLGAFYAGIYRQTQLCKDHDYDVAWQARSEEIHEFAHYRYIVAQGESESWADFVRRAAKPSPYTVIIIRKTPQNLGGVMLDVSGKNVHDILITGGFADSSVPVEHQ